MVPACGSIGGGFKKWTVVSAHLEARYFSFSQYATGDFQAATIYWSSEGVSLDMCGFFKGNCLGLQKPSPLTQSPLVFAARSFRDLYSWDQNPGLGGLVCGRDSSLLRYPSQIFVYHIWVKGHPIPHLHPSYQSGWMRFLLFCSCQTSIHLDF